MNTLGQDSTMQQVELASFNVVEFDNDSDLLDKYYNSNRFNLTESALERIPAVSLISRGNFAPEPIYRGFSAGQVNLTIDGMHMFGACTDKMDPVSSYVESNNLKAIECGSSSSENGAGLGGSINMETAKPNLEKKFYGHVASGYQSVSSGFNSSVGLGFNNDLFSGIFSSTFRMNDNYKDGNGNEVNYTQFSKVNASAKLVSNFSDFHRIKVDFIYDRAWDVGYAALPMDVSLAQAKIYSLTYERFFFGSSLKEIEFKVYGNNIYHEMDDSKRPDDEVPIRMDMPGWSDTYGAYTTFNWRKIAGHSFSLKADGFVHFSRAEMTMYPNDEAPMFMLTWPDVKRGVIGLLFADQWDINDRFAFNYSLRYDFSNSRIESEFGKNHLRVFGYDVDDPINMGIWNILVKPEWRVNESFKLNWIAAYKERLPTVSEQYGFYLFNAQDGYDYIGNPELGQESALQAEMSASLKKGSFEFGLSYFYYHLNNYIVGIIDPELSTMTIGANGVKIYEAMDHAYMTGFEGSAIWTIKNISWVNVLNFTYGKDSENEILPQLPPLKLTSTFTIKGKNWDISPEVVGAIKKDEVRESFGETSSPAWMIANLRASYSFGKNTAWNIQTGVENIFNTYYYEFLSWGEIPRPGTNFYVNVSFNF